MEAVTIALFTLAQALDFISTHYAITRLGAQEMMPVATWLIAQGWDVFLVAKLFTSAAFVPVYAYYRTTLDPKTCRWLLSMAVALSFAPVVGNIAQMVLFSIGG